MRTIILAALALLASAQVATAQQVNYIGPGNVRMPEGLVSYMQDLQAEQIESLKLFTTYLEKRVEEKAVPEGILLNVKSIYATAQLRASEDPAVKQQLLDELVEIDKKRIQLDEQTPNATWFGVNRVEIGKLMKAEHEAFRKEAEKPKQATPRKTK